MFHQVKLLTIECTYFKYKVQGAPPTARPKSARPGKIKE